MDPVQNGWTDTGTHTRDPRRPVETLGVWKPCPTCWGQGRIYVQKDPLVVAEYAHHTCGTCLGVGSVPSVEET